MIVTPFDDIQILLLRAGLGSWAFKLGLVVRTRALRPGSALPGSGMKDIFKAENVSLIHNFSIIISAARIGTGEPILWLLS